MARSFLHGEDGEEHVLAQSFRASSYRDPVRPEETPSWRPRSRIAARPHSASGSPAASRAKVAPRARA